jgi:hypothetical protein
MVIAEVLSHVTEVLHGVAVLFGKWLPSAQEVQEERPHVPIDYSVRRWTDEEYELWVSDKRTIDDIRRLTVGRPIDMRFPPWQHEPAMRALQRRWKSERELGGTVDSRQ